MKRIRHSYSRRTGSSYTNLTCNCGNNILISMTSNALKSTFHKMKIILLFVTSVYTCTPFASAIESSFRVGVVQNAKRR